MEETKRSGKKSVLLILVLLFAAALAALPFVLDRMSEAAGDGSSLLSASVTRRDISRTVSGAGIVGDKDPVSLTVPTDVVLTGYAVSDGDFVLAGDPVAWVDRVSVYKLIAELGEEAENIVTELAEVQNTWASSYISSIVAGTVTAVYAKDGDDIRSVMAQYGALAEIELENGTVLKVTATSGTILTAFIAPGDEVFVNAYLFSVSDVETMGAYGALVLRHQKLEELLAQLFQMYRDGYAAAPSDGMITGTDETLVKKLAAAEDDGGGIELLSYRPSDGEDPADFVKLAYMDSYVVTEYVAAELLDDGLISNTYQQFINKKQFPNAKTGDTVFMRVDTTYYNNGLGEYVGIPSYTVLLVQPQKSSDDDSKSKTGTGAGTGSGAGTGAATGAAASAAETVDVSTKAIASVVPMDEALVSISVDELDILSLRVGDAALVTIDALPGRSFEGVVTGVNTGLTNSGGNSKYTAEVTIARTPDMLDGMNASCLVTIETLKDVLTVPAAALCDENGAQLMYTALSRDKSGLSAPVPVEVGLSDGENLEILSGIEEGDTVWYKLFDTPEYTVSRSSRSSGFSFGMMGSNRWRR